jgi:hypothetical protein
MAVDLMRVGGMHDEPQARVVYSDRAVEAFGKRLDNCLQLSRTARRSPGLQSNIA